MLPAKAHHQRRSSKKNLNPSSRAKLTTGQVNFMNSIIKFFDKLEDKIRGRLSHYPIFMPFGGCWYSDFWRGVWHTTDFFTEVIFLTKYMVRLILDLCLGGTVRCLCWLAVSCYYQPVCSFLILFGAVRL